MGTSHKRLAASLAIRVHAATTHGECYARTQCLVAGPDDLPVVHAKHRLKIAAHVARFAGE
jgi:hypothetical protein